MTVYSIFKLVLSTSLMGSIVAAIVLLIKALFKNKLSANWHYYICFLVVLRLSLPYMPNSSVSVFNLFDSPVKQVSIYENIDKSSTVTNQATANISYTNNTQLQKSSSLMTTQILSFIWLIGVLIFLSYVLVSYLIFRAKISKDALCDDEDIINIAENCRKNLSIKQKIKLIDSKTIKTPTLLGIVKPRILFPNNVIHQFTNEEMKYIFIHEFIHLKRKDILLNWINTLVLAIHWFNPIVWILFMRMKKDCETSCDEMTLKRINSDEYIKYGETLIKLTSMFSKSSWRPNSVAIVNKSEIKRRIIMISKYKKKSFMSTLMAVMMLFLVACSSLTNGKKTESYDNKNNINNVVAVKSSVDDKKEADLNNTNSIQATKITPNEARQLILNEDGNYISKVTNNNTRLSSDYKEYISEDMPTANAWNIPKEPCYSFSIYSYDNSGEITSSCCEYLVGKNSKNVYVMYNQGNSSVYQIQNNKKVKTFKWLLEGTSNDWR